MILPLVAYAAPFSSVCGRTGTEQKAQRIHKVRICTGTSCTHLLQLLSTCRGLISQAFKKADRHVPAFDTAALPKSLQTQ